MNSFGGVWTLGTLASKMYGSEVRPRMKSFHAFLLFEQNGQMCWWIKNRFTIVLFFEDDDDANDADDDDDDDADGCDDDGLTILLFE